ncbi:MAG: hypothetical protein OEZ20_08830 [candidate division WOR-3 bacterium]|nr:hypothetical protein [candidate division WOR-3 bacterium]MDH5684552.1 hypothetical protein [candidate division WOR-3 bacterium]
MKLKIIAVILIIILHNALAISFEFVGNWPFGQANAMAFDEARKHIYLASGGGVYILDVSNPSKIKKISDAIRTRGVIKSALLQYPYLYLGGVGLGLEIWKVDNLKLPELVGKLDTLPAIKSIVFYENHLFLSSDDSIFVISIGKKQEMQIIGRYLAGNAIRGLSVFRTYLLYQSHMDIQILDIKNPKQLLPMGSLAVNRTLGFALKKDTLYQATEDPPHTFHYFLKIFSLNDFSNPKRIAVKTNPDGFKMFLKGDPLYSIFEGLILIKASETLDFKFDLRDLFWRKYKKWGEDRYLKGIAGDIKDGYVYDDLVYLLSQSQGLSIWDLRNIKEPKFLSYFPIPSLPQSLAFYKSNALIVFRDKGIRIFDISDLNFIKEIFYYPYSRQIPDIKIIGKHAYTGYEILDISNPQKPSPVSSCIYGINHFEIDYPYMYASEYYSDAFFILDLSKNNLLTEVGFRYGLGIKQFIIKYPYAYSLTTKGLSVFDISDPTFPFEIYNLKDIKITSHKIQLLDSLICIYGGRETQLLQILAPTEFRIIIPNDSFPSDIRSVATENKYLFTVSHPSTLRVFKIISTDKMDYLGSYQIEDKLDDEIFVKFPYIFIPTTESGIQIIKFNP